MMSIPLWQLVLFVLSGVALGAVVAILAFTRGKYATGRPEPASVSRASDKVADPAASLTAAASRQDRIKTFLKKRITKMRNVTVDEASKALGVSPRRVRRLMDDGTLVAIPTTDGGRLVSAVSVLDLIGRREAAMAKSQEVVEPAANSTEVPAAVEAKEKPEPGTRQLYWYYVDGHDEPLRSIREALQILGLNYAYTGWNEIPGNVRVKIRRERV